MSTATQATGVTSETLAAQATNGYLGWSPEADRGVYSLLSGGDGTAATTYAGSTAYAVGKTVTYGGVTYVVITTVTSGNTTAPDTNVKFRVRDNHRGAAEQGSASTGGLQFYR